MPASRPPTGQSCIAAKRFIVVPEVRERFEARLTDRLARGAPRGPLDEQTEVGPLARWDLRDDLHQQVEASRDRGARLLVGGQILPGPGSYSPPTVLTAVAPGMPAYHEELFGPVAAILPAKDEQDALRIANDSAFGLGAARGSRRTSSRQGAASSTSSCAPSPGCPSAA